MTQPKLLDQYRERLRIKHYSLRTEQAYLHWVRRFIFFHGKRHPAGLGGPEVERFLSHLATEGRVSASTQNQALAALLFLYREVLGKELPWMDGVVRAKRPARVPVVLSENEVRALLAQLDGKRWLVAALLYATGMRLLEGLRLRVKDVDFERREITVRDGKGGRDRRTMLPERLIEALRARTLLAYRCCTSATSRRVSARFIFRSRSRANIRGRDEAGLGSTCFHQAAGQTILSTGRCGGTIWMRKYSSAPCWRQRARPGWPSPSLRMSCGTASPHTCSKAATTSGPCRSYSATRTFRRRWSTRTFSTKVAAV